MGNKDFISHQNLNEVEKPASEETLPYFSSDNALGVGVFKI
jgi:hypothetical protein